MNVNVNFNNEQTEQKQKYILQLIYDCYSIIITQIKSLDVDTIYNYPIMIYFIGNFGMNIESINFSPINFNNNVLTLTLTFTKLYGPKEEDNKNFTYILECSLKQLVYT